MHIKPDRMPTELPQSRRTPLNRWHIAGIAIGFMTVTGLMMWIVVERASLTESETTGIAPSAQSSRPLPIE